MIRSLTYDIYFGDSSNPSLRESDYTGTTYDPGELNYSTTYYWKIVAKDDHGLETEGPVWSFETESGLETGTVTDIDGNVYQTVKIGDQWWMAENLKVTHYRNGDPIPNVTDNTDWSNLSTGASCNYDNEASNVATYGRLYNWYAVSDSRQIAPAGWHMPSDAEWQTLIDYLGGESVAGGKMKETGTTHWGSPNASATNESGFAALPGGYHLYYYGTYYSLCNHAYFWSSTEDDSSTAWYRSLRYDGSDVYRYGYYKQDGFSVRCVRD
ncbi:MAG: fibrobacter succinogenes major paralogous domain-containing protein [Candidatus Marinimicrobia bacterium]|nr:fibrobacter succinogenes major paralogous domain-containing protein [bacterium]MCG2714964.1 fibrobacter succinogenes major paralogous domain-containing protein [Candidatus Neomarinimicrobiota bacterium]